ncbi:hypothetical protein NBRC116188_21260 [Oceaniserpentilla sp. 4NH20-0058]
MLIAQTLPWLTLIILSVFTQYYSFKKIRPFNHQNLPYLIKYVTEMFHVVMVDLSEQLYAH